MPNTREKLIELIGLTEYGNGSLIGKNFQKGFIEKIADHLIANGVKIPVLCKECKHFIQEEHGCNHFGYYSHTPWVDEVDFCSYGERREQ